MRQLVLIRHGESVWNRENRFTGWVDVGLSEKGVQEAKGAGRALAKEGLSYDVAFTSVLCRAIATLWHVLDEMGLQWLPVEKSWRLNERHYGGLQGLNKAEMAKQFGEAQVKLWRRSFDVAPPPLKSWDRSWPGNDRRYSSGVMPACESLKDTIARTLPYWHDVIAPALHSGKRVMVAAHGNSLRGLIKYLDQIPNDEIPGLELPTGVPRVYELDDGLRPLRHYNVVR